MDRVRWGDGADFLVRVLGPVLLLCGAVVGFGLAVVGPLSAPLNAEDSVNQGLADRRNGIWNSITYVWSFLGSTEAIVGVCLVVFAGVLWHSRDWRLAVVPAMAIVLQLGLYLTVTALIHRERPSVERMDALPPLSSYPSGHVGASTALYLALILIASRVERVGVRWAITVICATVPLLVGASRLYRGVHHISDIIVGMLCGAGCALLAYGWYRHRMHAATLRARSGP
jgi:membrane-associated phospholipid phosphatase